MSEKKLKQCPFCGGQNIMVESKRFSYPLLPEGQIEPNMTDKWKTTTSYCIKCPICRVEIIGDKSAFAAWNRRAK